MTLAIGSVVAGKVTSIEKTYARVDVNGTECTVHISELSDYFVKSINSLLKIGETYSFEVIELRDKKHALSWKNLVPRYCKSPFKFKIEETKSGFTNLKKAIKDK